MKISSKGRYALRMLLDLAEHRNCGCIALKDIADRQGISKKYLEQIIPTFTKSGILKTVRGPQGGYQLTKSPDRCTVGEILRLTEGPLFPVVSADEPGSPGSGEDFAIASVWQGLSTVVTEYLDGITLQDIMNKRGEQTAIDYII